MHSQLSQHLSCLVYFLRLFLYLNLAAATASTPEEPDLPAPLRPRKVETKDRHFFKYVTRPDIDAPTWSVNVHDSSALAPGYWFLAPYEDLDQRQPGEGWIGPHIYDNDGQLIWSGTGMFQHWNAFDFGMAQGEGGTSVLTVLWPHGNSGLIIDGRYQVRKRVVLDQVRADMHAFRLLNEGKRALIVTHEHVETTAEEATPAGFNGSCAVAYDGFAELEVETGKPVFEWSGRWHVGLDEGTYNSDRLDWECKHNWDLLHMNAVDKFANGDYLISARHTDAVYKVSHTDGSIVWRLGGTKSDFTFMGPGNAVFSRQHHAYVVAENGSLTTISLFDNAIGTGPVEHETNSKSRGMLLQLNMTDMTARIQVEYENPAGHTVNSRGSFQILSNGNAFLCWTYSSQISEHTADGSLVMQAILPVQAHTYRAFKFPWVGRPTQPPDVVAEVISTKRGDNHTLVHVSWNGATEVARWDVRLADDGGEVENRTALTRAAREGFETAITYEGVAEYVFVEAYDGKGESLGRSEVVRTIPLGEIGKLGLHRALMHSPSLPPPDDGDMKQARPSHGQVMQAESSRTKFVHKFAKVKSSVAKRSSIAPSVLGFACCVVLGFILYRRRSSRRREASWRRPMGMGHKYELLMQEHLL